MTAIDLVKRYGYEIADRNEAEAGGRMPAGLKERMSEYPGKFILFDPHDDWEGFCLVGDDVDNLAAEFVKNSGINFDKDELTDFLKNLKVVWIVMTDSQDRNGSLWTVTETIQEAMTAALELGGWRDAIVYPLAMNSRPFDEAHKQTTRGQGVQLFDISNMGETPTVDLLVTRYEAVVGRRFAEGSAVQR